MRYRRPLKLNLRVLIATDDHFGAAVSAPVASGRLKILWPAPNGKLPSDAEIHDPSDVIDEADEPSHRAEHVLARISQRNFGEETGRPSFPFSRELTKVPLMTK
jgi:hypothetical protein